MSDDLFANPEICQAVLMDYYRNPRCAGVCESPTHQAESNNPACGDIVKLSFEISGATILQARGTGAGCAVSQASASLLAERLEGKSLTEAQAVIAEMDRMLAGEAADAELLDRLGALRMITTNPARVRCARTARDAAMAALSR